MWVMCMIGTPGNMAAESSAAVSLVRAFLPERAELSSNTHKPVIHISSVD
jgi:hypothetical protein